MDPVAKSFTQTIDNSSEIVEDWDRDDFVSSVKRSKLSSQARAIEPVDDDDDDEIICLD